MTQQALSREELSTQGAWIAVPVGSQEIERYRQLTSARAELPAGLAVAIARRAFSRGRPLPPGGVMLGVDAALGEWDAGRGAEFRCGTRERADSAGRAIVTIDVELRSAAAGARPTTVSFAIRWPEEADSDG